MVETFRSSTQVYARVMSRTSGEILQDDHRRHACVYADGPPSPESLPLPRSSRPRRIGANAAPATPAPTAATPLTGDDLGAEYEFVDNRAVSPRPAPPSAPWSATTIVVTRWNNARHARVRHPGQGPRSPPACKGDAETVGPRVPEGTAGPVLAADGRRRRPGHDRRDAGRRRHGRAAAPALRRPARRPRRPGRRRGPRRRRPAGQLLAEPADRRPRAGHASRAAEALTAALARRRDHPRPAGRPPGPPGGHADARRRAARRVRGRGHVDDAEHPLGYTTYVDAARRQGPGPGEPGQLRRRRPALEGLPGHRRPARHRHPADLVRGGRGPAARGTSLDPATGKTWDVDAATGQPTLTTTRQLRRDRTALGQRQRRRCPRRPSPTASTSYPFTNQWDDQQVRPGLADHAAAGRRRRGHREPVRDAQPDARLVLPPRASPRPPGTCRRPTPAGTARAATPSAATPSRARPPPTTRNNANQTTPPDGMQPVTNMYMWQPFAGARVPALRRRRLRHDGHRPRVHPRHHQPHDRRPGQRHHLDARAARWARAGPT